jgi:hypothetical protein
LDHFEIPIPHKEVLSLIERIKIPGRFSILPQKAGGYGEKGFETGSVDDRLLRKVARTPQ